MQKILNLLVDDDFFNNVRIKTYFKKNIVEYHSISTSTMRP
jgi:hypothetical protein